MFSRRDDRPSWGGPTDGHAVGGPDPWTLQRARAVDPEVDSALAAVGAVCASTGSILDGQRLRARVVALTALQATVDAARLDALGELDASRAWETDGSATPAGWLTRHTPVDRRDAVADLRCAKRLGRCPGVGAALAEGRITGRAARLLATACADDPVAFAELQEAFLAVAETGSLANLRRVTQQWREMVKPPPPGTDPYDEHIAKRRLSLSTSLDGVGYLNGRLDPVSTAKVSTAIDALAEQYRLDDLAAHQRACDLAKAQGLPAPTLDPTTLRTPTQRRADAFVTLILAGADALAEPSHPQHTPRCTTRVTVRCDAPDLLHLGDDADDGREKLVPVTLGNTAVLLPHHTLETLCCDATVRRVLLDAAGVPLDVGRASRTATPAQRAAVIERDETCIFPSCTIHAADCDMHHITPWNRGGSSDIGNLAPGCNRHHHIFHGPNGWNVHMADDGRPTVTHNGIPQPRNTPPPRLSDLREAAREHERPPDG